ncbi:Protein NIM1-INTERACTING 2 like [Actinidia chinensis var. chinensis]|uniref:Protein NIM1-INTERACTING 2 like n=1 Tax=Actinidia chinensis var. chinensis TaxID=1590841 RepID=A0A2R6PU05_ACTCC|nr:Protein NIM1-INTERACTING 2 like [Actinidia chinensis var. chinensis]
MEGEKKRKRAADGGVRRREKETEKKAEAEGPSEEEVEEFFAILRRMHVAVKYFEKSNGNGDRSKLTGKWCRARTELEAEALVGVNGAKAEEESLSGVRKIGVLDLNAVPDAENNSI